MKEDWTNIKFINVISIAYANEVQFGGQSAKRTLSVFLTYCSQVFSGIGKYCISNPYKVMMEAVFKKIGDFF